MKKTKTKGWTAYRGGHRLNRTVTLMDGRRIRLYSGRVDSVSEGEKDIARQVEKYNAGIAEENERRKGIFPLGEYIERYLDRLPGMVSAKTGKPYAESTICRKRTLYEQQIKGTDLAKKKINLITAHDIELFKYGLETRKNANNSSRVISNNTRNKVITLLSEVFSDFYRLSEHPEANPMTAIKRYTESYTPKTMDDFLEDDEIARLMAVNKEYRDAPRPGTNDRQYSDIIDLSILLHTRPGELIALKARDYNAASGELRIRRTLTMHKIGKDGHAKTDRSIRTISLNSRECGIIESNINGKKAGDLIFAGARGGIISESDLNRSFRKRLAECGIDKELTMYRTRGTGITFALAHGADPAGVAGISGHSQKTMYQHYAAITSKQVKAAARVTGEAFDELLDKSTCHKG